MVSSCGESGCVQRMAADVFDRSRDFSISLVSRNTEYSSTAQVTYGMISDVRANRFVGSSVASQPMTCDSVRDLGSGIDQVPGVNQTKSP